MSERALIRICIYIKKKRVAGIIKCGKQTARQSPMRLHINNLVHIRCVCSSCTSHDDTSPICFCMMWVQRWKPKRTTSIALMLCVHCSRHRCLTRCIDTCAWCSPVWKDDGGPCSWSSFIRFTFYYELLQVLLTPCVFFFSGDAFNWCLLFYSEPQQM